MVHHALSLLIAGLGYQPLPMLLLQWCGSVPTCAAAMSASITRRPRRRPRYVLSTCGAKRRWVESAKPCAPEHYLGQVTTGRAANSAASCSPSAKQHACRLVVPLPAVPGRTTTSSMWPHLAQPRMNLSSTTSVAVAMICCLSRSGGWVRWHRGDGVCRRGRLRVVGGVLVAHAGVAGVPPVEQFDTAAAHPR